MVEICREDLQGVFLTLQARCHFHGHLKQEVSFILNSRFISSSFILHFSMAFAVSSTILSKSVESIVLFYLTAFMSIPTPALILLCQNKHLSSETSSG